MLPQSEKNILWENVKEHFTIPEGLEAKVKEWTLKKMATQFQTYKKNLEAQYTKKGIVDVFYWQAHEGYPNVVILFGRASRILELDGERIDNNLLRFRPRIT